MIPSRSTTRRPVALVGLAAVIVAVLPVSAALADEPGAPVEVVTVQGTLVNLAVEVTQEQHVAGLADDMVVETMVEVDGALYPLPDDVPVDGGVTGQAVEIAIAAEAGLEPEEAIALATADLPPVGTPEALAAAVAAETSEPTPVASAEDTPAAEDTAVEDTPAADDTAVEDAPVVDETPAPTPDVAEGEAEVLAVTATGDPAAAAEVLAEAVVGNHTLTVLPVHWGNQDATTTATLASLANQTAQYWSEQSGGRISMSTSVRNWATIPNPQTCNTAAIMQSALAANGLSAGSATNHVLVYFPKMSACGGWAGLASIGGGSIWVNGTPIIDVFTHEFGHNLGVGHANTATCTSGGTRVPFASLSSCTVREYQDTADVMGYAISGKASGNLNTALADHLGLATVLRPTTSSPVTVDLAQLSSTGSTRAVAIPVAEGTIYVDFRPATGRDTRQPAWAGVQVHLRTMDPVHRYPTSYLLDMSAPAGGEFAAPAFPAGGSWSVPGSGLVVTVQSVGSTSARVSVTAGSAGLSPSTGTLDNYIGRVYQDLFGRAVDPGGLQGWRNALLNGEPRISVANAITYSREYRTGLITDSYEYYLGRQPDGGGLEGWLGAMGRGLTIQQMEAGFLGAPEYYQNAGNSDATWVTRLYQHVLGRAPAASEVQAWVSALHRSNRYEVSLGFLMSSEHLATVVNGHYLTLLDRGLDSGGQSGWVRAIQTGTRLEAVIGGIIASDEYYAKG